MTGADPASVTLHRSDALARLDATDLLTRFAERSLRPSEVVHALLDRAAAIDPALNAFVARDAAILERAHDSDARWASGSPCGPLDGVPLVIKDNLHVAGLPTSWGNARLAGETVARDELPVARLRAAGALLLGKANVPEFTLEGHTSNRHFGITRNPWDTALVPGGSSGGVVAAVAAGLAAAGLGTDGGGSIRRPAGYTGLIGLKPGIGAVARADGLPPLLLDFETVGPLTCSVRDAALLFETLAGADRRDAASRTACSDTRFADPPRVLVVARIDDAPVEPCILEALDRSADAFAALGCDVRHGELPVATARIDAHWTHIGEMTLARLFTDRPDVAASAAPEWRDAAARGAARGAGEALALLDDMQALRDATSAAFGDIDALLLPSSAAMPWPVEHRYPARIAGTDVGPRGHAAYTGWVNAAGHPALALPAPVEQGALPIGVQLVGDLGSERALLDLGARYERALGGVPLPPLPAVPQP